MKRSISRLVLFLGIAGVLTTGIIGTASAATNGNQGICQGQGAKTASQTRERARDCASDGTCSPAGEAHRYVQNGAGCGGGANAGACGNCTATQ